jgi:hypothetical protein
VVYDNPLAFFRQCRRWLEWDMGAKEPAANQRVVAIPHAKEALAGAKP